MSTKNISFRTLFVISFLFPLCVFAYFPITAGIFVIRGFSNSHLLWQPTDSGSVVDVGALGVGASRVRTGANYIFVTNSGSFSTGIGSALWYATFDSVGRAIRQQRPVTWRVCNFPDYSNAYDVAFSNGFAWVTLLGTSQLVQVDLASDSIVTTISVGANPQDVIAMNGAVYVSCSGYGSGNQLFKYTIQPAQLDSFTVGVNPQGLAVDPTTQNIYVACAGRSWATPPVSGGLARANPVFGAHLITDTIGSFFPASVCFTSNGNVFLSDEYGSPQCKKYIYNSITHDESFQSLPFIGGWQLIATPDSGVYVVSVGDSAIREYGSNNGLLTTFHIGGVPEAAIYWQGQSTSVREQQNTIATHFDLPQVYPNPFNATTQVRYILPTAGFVKVALYNAQGRLVSILVNAKESAGTHSLTLSGERLSSGTYFLSLESSRERATRSIQLLK